ncbi:response regulator transcription factor [Ideonella azotifigens]|uniref:Response regulator transcription factor n=1 Tax=Ideonella azotifigens TaxID=513160 RepID=A0ABN1JL34_9BURK|nr:response regulator transcription factor [Ideonella azotifigens]MCD2339672.1 response regulator transcription factor [Ideonella azotifigens]
MPQFAALAQRVIVKHTEPILAMGLMSALGQVPEFEVSVDTTGSAQIEHGRGARVIVCDHQAAMQLDNPGRAGIVAMAGKPREFEIQRAMEKGVLGYVASGCSLAELQCAVRAAAQGRRYLCPVAAQELANSLSTEALTSREHDVLTLLAQGCCNKTIGNRLAIAAGTVKAHVRAILAKLDASTRTEAANIAIARGLLPEPTVASADTGAWRVPAFMPTRQATPHRIMAA